MNTSVRVASTANLIASTAEVGQMVDGVVLGPHDRLLLKNQTRPYENGIIEVQPSGASVFVRAADMAPGAFIPAGSTVVVNEGTANADKSFVLLGIDPIRVAMDDLVFTDAVAGTVPTTRRVDTAGPLTGGGSLASNLTLGVEGLPTGGTTGQVLTKASNADYDTAWISVVFGGAVSWLVSHTPAFLMNAIANLGNLFSHLPALVVDATRNSLSIGQNPALLVSLNGVVGELVQQIHLPALLLSARISDFKLPETPALEVVRVQYDLLRLVGGNAQAAVGTAWTSPANAISGTNGLHDASNATCEGSVGGNTNGIELTYANHSNKGDLAITNATLNLYAAGVDATGLLLTTVVSYDVGAGYVVAETIIGAFSNLTTPRTYNLTGILDAWTKYDALKVKVVCTFAALSALSNASLDAIEINIAASKTDVP